MILRVAPAGLVLVTAVAVFGGLPPRQLAMAGIASLQLAAAASLAMRGRQPGGLLAWPAIVSAVALAACLALPGAAAFIGALARLAVYASLLRLFGRSLRQGREPVVTNLARRIHPAMTADRIAYTRAVTWLWTVFFAAQVAAWTVVLALAPFRPEPWFAAWADLPFLAALIAGELAVRAIRFRGRPHGSLGDMLRAVRRP